MKTELIIYDLDEMTELISAAKSYEENSKINCCITKDLAVIDELIIKNRSAIFIFSIRTKDKFQALINIFKKNIKDIKNGRIKIAYFQHKKNQKIENILRKFNCNDFLDSEISKKSLCYKIDIWDKRVLSNIRKDELAEVSLSSRPSAKKILKDNTKRIHRTVLISSIEEKFDIWISSANSPKNVLSKWLVNFKGPSPHISSWESVEDGVWKFEIEKSVKSQFLNIEGNWYFKGIKPEFNWKEKLWSFSSNDFNLYFKDINDVITSRAFSEGHDLSLRENSKYANLLADLISKSADSKVSLESNNTKNEENVKNSLKGSKTKQEFMEAESKTERLNSKLTGKSKGEEPQSGNFKGQFKKSTLKESSNFSLKLDPKKEGNLSGNLKKNESKDSNLSGSLKNNESKDGNLSGSFDKSESKDGLSNEKKKESSLSSNKDSKAQKNKEPLEHTDLGKKKTEKKSKDLAAVAKLSLSQKENKKKKSLLSENEGLVEKPKSEMEKAMINPAVNAVRISNDSVFYLCDLVDLFEEELYVTVKKNEIDKALDYNIVLSIIMGSQKATITTQGRVDSVDDEIYKFSITKIPQADYDKFMSHFEIKQDEINDFLIAARGF